MESLNQINFMVGTVEEDNEVMVVFKGFDSISAKKRLLNRLLSKKT